MKGSEWLGMTNCEGVPPMWDLLYIAREFIHRALLCVRVIQEIAGPVLSVIVLLVKIGINPIEGLRERSLRHN